MMLSCEYIASSWSARMSKSLQVASSEPVANAFPEGKNWKFLFLIYYCDNLGYFAMERFLDIAFLNVFGQEKEETYYRNGVDIRLVAGERLFAHSIPKNEI